MKAVIEEETRKNLEKNKLGIIVSTDLTTASNTVNHKILLKKLQYYGIKDKLLNSLNLS